MQITHVIRGEDHLSNTPKQILIFRALGFAEPIFAHIPLILNADRSKMSKRFSDTALLNYRDRGYVAEAMVNFLILLGWHPTGDKEVYSIKELIAAFEMDRVQQSGAIFNEEKLDWLNREHMKAMPVGEVVELVAPFFANKNIVIKDDALLTRVVGVQISRAKTLAEIVDVSGFFFALPDYEPALLIWKDSSTLKEVGTILLHAKEILENIAPENFTRQEIMLVMPTIIGDKSRGMVLWPLRVALSGQANSPDPVEIMEVLGKDESLKRIDVAMQKSDALK
jgi:glutamyl-tRNA synthetase